MNHTKNCAQFISVYLVYLHDGHIMFHFQMSVIQTGPTSLAVDMFSNNNHQDLKTDIQIKGVYATKVTFYGSNLKYLSNI